MGSGFCIQPLTTNDEGTCIWYGECTSWFGFVKHNCLNYTKALPLDGPGRELISEICPHFVTNSTDSINTCCDFKQLKSLHKHITSLPAVKLHDACKREIVKHLCDVTCAPHQSRFIKVIKTGTTRLGEILRINNSTL